MIEKEYGRYKFRAWSIGAKRMFSWEKMMDNLGKFYTYFKWPDVYKLMQYTGLKDKNGMEIYEGDIVIAETYFEHIRGAITYDEGAFFIGDEPGAYAMFVCDDFDIIGNIYENPWLIGGAGEEGFRQDVKKKMKAAEKKMEAMGFTDRPPEMPVV